MQTFAVIAAGGTGSRMGAEKPKQFLPVNGKPVLWHTIHAFLQFDAELKVILVLPPAHIQEGLDIMNSFGQPHRFDLVTGGDTRFQSVKNGLSHVPPGSIVFVHDAARCLVSQQLIRHCYETALAQGSAIPAIRVGDSLRLLTGAHTHEVLNREHVRIIQTPQTFQSDILLSAFAKEYDPAFTDEATVAEANGSNIILLEGETTNIKITWPADLLLAERILYERAAV
jgi:2-C-methyl-D-erythritol 4-phosphate cytidylyltransferase